MGLPSQAVAFVASPAGLTGGATPVADASSVPRPTNWLEIVNQPQTEAEVESLRETLRRGRPFWSFGLDDSDGRASVAGTEPAPAWSHRKAKPAASDSFGAPIDQE